MTWQKKTDDDLFKQIMWNLDYFSKHYNPKKKLRQNIFCWNFNNIVKADNSFIWKLELFQKYFRLKKSDDNHQTK